MGLINAVLMHLLAKWIGKSIPEGQTQTLDEQIANPPLAEGVAKTISAHSEGTREGQNLSRLVAAVKSAKATEAKEEPIQQPHRQKP